MLGSLAGWFPQNGDHSAARAAPRRRIRRVRCRIEPLEARSLLSAPGSGGPDVDQPPVLASLATQSVEEGNTLAVQVTATDPNPGHTVTYSLDPGAPAGATINPTTGLFVWTPPNVQAIYAITVRATDSGPEGLSAAETLNVMVFDVPPTVQAGNNATVTLGTEFEQAGTFTDPNPDTWTATVDYGDGTGVQPLALNPDKSFELAHDYTAPGTYIVSVTITDSQNGVGHGYFAVQVLPQDAPSPSTSSSTSSSTGNGTTSSTTSSGSAAPQAQSYVQTTAPAVQGADTTSSPTTKAKHSHKAPVPKVKHPRPHVVISSSGNGQKLY